ncbi:MAG TPA: universal stress protein [Pyrinomonadaceae bacterium]|jgi:nucleotide-binding universal stress UspA family protein|nr:universal stress protein [Pyrinomonadaceae bacterium]
MIRAILFPTDFSSVANSAFPLAVAIAAQFEAIVQSVHIAHGGDPHITETSRYEFPGLPTGASSVRVIETIIPKVGEDDPAEVIMRTAQDRLCDLIVMASHGRSDVAQFFLGRSVAEQVARDSKIPTMIARLYGPRRTTRPIDRFKTVVFATDLSEKSKHILPVAAAIAKKTKAKLNTLCVFGEGDEEPADGGKAQLSRFFEEAGAPELFGIVRRVHGGVAEAVVEHAGRHKADLIAITTNLCCGGDERMTGTAEFIIRNAPCPVLCVRP